MSSPLLLFENPIDEFIALKLKSFTLVFSLYKVTFEFITFVPKVLFIPNTAPSIPSMSSPGVVSKVMFSYILLESITDAGSL